MTSLHTPAETPAPKLTISKAEGATVPDAAHLTFKEGKAASTIQPNPKHLVFFHLDEDECVMAISFMEPVLGVPLSWVVNKLCPTEDGKPSGAAAERKHAFLSVDDLMAFLAKLETAISQALKSLDSSAEPCAV